MKFETIVVGGGIAGLTAAAYLAKADRPVLVLEKQLKVGGLVQTFQRDGIYFDAGLRSIENSGIVFPMLKQLGIEIEFIKSQVSIGIDDRILKLENKESLIQYQAFLQSLYPENALDISNIVNEIKKIMGYMDVLYGIDNPAFINIKEDKTYLLKVLLPWLFKYLFTIGKITKLDEPAEDYLKRFTKNQSLIDVIAQHFFQKTPTSFALSYFSLYLDYYYPKGGTASLIEKIENYLIKHGGVIKTDVSVESLNPEEKYLLDNRGTRIDYDQLIWACDTKYLYHHIPIEELKDMRLKRTVLKKRSSLKDLRGGDSVFTVYLSVEENKSYFSDICTGHFFYTPDKRGLSILSKGIADQFLNEETNQPDKNELKSNVKKYLEDFCKLNTFEIAIPALRDTKLAPEGRTGVIISILFDYRLAKKIDDFGWSNEMKDFLEQTIIQILDEKVFKGIKSKIISCFSSSPLTIEKMTGNTHGGITGWAFTNPYLPVIKKMSKVAKSIETPLPNIYQAGQWVFSPSGLPISILTGKFAADKILSSKRRSRMVNINR